MSGQYIALLNPTQRSKVLDLGIACIAIPALWSCHILASDRPVIGTKKVLGTLYWKAKVRMKTNGRLLRYGMRSDRLTLAVVSQLLSHIHDSLSGHENLQHDFAPSDYRRRKYYATSV